MITLTMDLGAARHEYVDVAVAPQHIAAIRRPSSDTDVPGCWIYLAGDPQPIRVRDGYCAVLKCVEAALSRRPVPVPGHG